MDKQQAKLVVKSNGRLGNILFNAMLAKYNANIQGKKPILYFDEYNMDKYELFNQIYMHYSFFNNLSTTVDKSVYESCEIMQEQPSCCEYTKLPISNQNIAVGGFRQNPKYFSKTYAQGQIMHEEPVWNAINELYQQVDFNDFVSLQVRRKDYLLVEKAGLTVNHPDFYERIKKLFSKNQKYIILSDDIEWCKSQPCFFGGNFMFQDKHTGIPHIDILMDIYIPTLCRHNVISNSTFGWWGAYLNPTPGRNVYYQKPWFNLIQAVQSGDPCNILRHKDAGMGIIPENDSWFGLRYK